MQPERNPDEWQQPSQQPTQAPYVANPDVASRPAPVVTLTPESVAPAPVVAAPPPSPPEQAVSPAPLPQPAPSQPTPPPVTPASTPLPDTEATEPEQPKASSEPLHWQANEYVHHEKSPVWFILFVLVAIVLIAIALFLIKSVTFAVLVPVMAAALLVYTRRPPRLIDYTLSPQGLHINDRLYSFAEFKGFGVIHDGSEYSVMLIPVKRFRPGVSVYFPEEAGETLVDMLGARLPMQELHLDVVDKVIHKLRI